MTRDRDMVTVTVTGALGVGRGGAQAESLRQHGPGAKAAQGATRTRCSVLRLSEDDRDVTRMLSDSLAVPSCSLAVHDGPGEPCRAFQSLHNLAKPQSESVSRSTQL